MSDQTWYYTDESETQHGPISIPELQSLVSNGVIIPQTQVWTEALGEQWIPAANVEGLFPATPSVAPTLRTPTLATSVQEVEEEPKKPALAATTPMIASTPTTQAVTGVPVPKSLAVQQPATPAAAATAQPPAQPQTSDPYQSPEADPQPLADGMYPATIKKGGSMGFWSMLFFGGILSMILGAMVAGMFSPDTAASLSDQTLNIGLGLIILGYVCLLFSGILIYIYLYRAWKCLQPGGATVSPGAAIGFLFIPIFNIYWIFKAIGGLPKQWNLITSSFSNTKNAPKLTVGAFICLLLIPVIGQIIWLSQITRGINFMAALHFQQSRPAGSALAGLSSSANFK